MTRIKMLKKHLHQLILYIDHQEFRNQEISKIITYLAMSYDTDDEPLTVEEAMASNDHMWTRVMSDKIDSLAKNET